MIWKAPDLSGFGRTTIWHEGLKAWMHVQFSSGVFPLACNHRADRETFSRVSDRIFEEILKRELAELARQLYPLRHYAWDSDGFPAAVRHGGHALETLGRPCCRGASRGVQPVYGLAIPQDSESVTTDAVHGWLDHGQGNRCSERGINRVTATCEGGSARLRGQGLRGRDNVTRQHGLTARGEGQLVVHEFKDSSEGNTDKNVDGLYLSGDLQQRDLRAKKKGRTRRPFRCYAKLLRRLRVEPF